MARYEYPRNITHSCGHTERQTFYAHNRQEADSWAQSLRKSPCSACEEEAKTLAAQGKTVNLPELSGAPSQVQWAASIRQRIYTVLLRTDKYRTNAQLCGNESNACWWIEHRSDPLRDIIAHLREKGRRAA